MRCFYLLLLLLNTLQVVFAQDKLPPLTVEITLQNQTDTPYLCQPGTMTLLASSSETGLTYNWYREGQLYQTVTDATLRLREAGTYFVVIKDGQREAASNKISILPCPNNQAEIDTIWKQAEAGLVPKKPITAPIVANTFTATIASTNPVLCNNNSSATLVAFPQGNQFTYQWQYAGCLTCSYTNQSGLINDTLITTNTGFWRVIVTENSSSVTSNFLRVSWTPYAILTDQSDNSNGIVTISPSQSASLKVSFTGQGPYIFTYSDGTSSRNITTGMNPYTLVVTPDQNRRYTLTSAGSNSCGSSGDLVGNIRVVIDPTTSVTLPAPANLNVCAGSTISIPYTTVGTWAGARNLSIRLIDELDGSLWASVSGLSTSPLQITIPASTPVNRQL